MVWLAVDKDKKECVYEHKPFRDEFGEMWINTNCSNYIELPKGSIKKLIGWEMKWEDNPVEI